MTAPDSTPRLFGREGRTSETADSANGTSGRGEGSETGDLLRALLIVNGRIAFPEDRLRPLVSPTGVPTYLRAYRMCDGRTGLTEIAKAVGLDLGSLSKAVTRWVEAGIAFRVGAKRHPLHLYPLTVEDAKVRASAKPAAASGPASRAGGRRAGGASKVTARAPSAPSTTATRGDEAESSGASATGGDAAVEP